MWSDPRSKTGSGDESSVWAEARRRNLTVSSRFSLVQIQHLPSPGPDAPEEQRDTHMILTTEGVVDT